MNKKIRISWGGEKKKKDMSSPKLSLFTFVVIERPFVVRERLS